MQKSLILPIVLLTLLSGYLFTGEKLSQTVPEIVDVDGEYDGESLSARTPFNAFKQKCRSLHASKGLPVICVNAPEFVYDSNNTWFKTKTLSKEPHVVGFKKATKRPNTGGKTVTYLLNAGIKKCKSKMFNPAAAALCVKGAVKDLADGYGFDDTKFSVHATKSFSKNNWVFKGLNSYYNVALKRNVSGTDIAIVFW